MKRCNKCEETKPLSEFFKDKNNKTDGHYSICKLCKEAATYLWRDKNREKYNADHRTYNKANYHKMRLQRYKLTPEDHARMMSEQKGVCAICGCLPKGKRPLCVDHCHAKGHVRGLLCYGCNRALHVLESVELLEKAKAYLKKHK